MKGLSKLLDKTDAIQKYSGLNPTENLLIHLLLEQKSTGITNKQIAEQLGVSESYMYRLKRKPKVDNILQAYSIQSARQLLDKAVSTAEKMLDDPNTSASAKATIISTVFKSNGMFKEADKSSESVTDTPVDLDQLMIKYGIRKAE